jgi:hypothetical protein
MWRLIQKQRVRIVLLSLAVIFSLVSFINLPPSYQEQAQMINTIPPLVKLDINLKALLIYNRSERSIVGDLKDFFNRDLPSTSKVYDMHKLNVMSLLVLIAIPFFMSLAILILLHTSLNVMLLIITIFFCFTFLPMLIL